MAIAPLIAAVAAQAPAAVLPSGAGAPRTERGGTSNFASTLGNLLAGVERSTTDANAAVSGMLTKSVDVHDAMIALQRSELSLQLVVQVRNKLVQAYQDIMRMPI
jgi:flagellar hook-basal body complex protein FliE